MKTRFFNLCPGVLVAVGVTTLTALGQVTTNPGGETPIGTNAPIASIRATVPFANEIGPVAGRFTVYRDRGIRDPLLVMYRIGGTASNGVDYQTISNTIVIPAGSFSADLEIMPIPDSVVEGNETVLLQLVPLPVMTPLTPYVIGRQSTARVTIMDGVTNLQARVTVVTTKETGTEIPTVPPGMGMPQRIDPAIFTVLRTGDTRLPLTVFYSLAGTASNGVDYVELPGTLIIPAGTNSAPIEVLPIADDQAEGKETVVIRIEPPICIAIFPPPPDCYALGIPSSATAYILDGPSLTNRPPEVKITAPPNGSVFRAPADVPIEATTLDVDGYAPKVEFYANDRKIGEQEIVFIQAPPPGQPINFSFVWSNVMAGAYSLTAVATDNLGATKVSVPVRIAVSTSNAPPTNLPPIVTIVATDPFATEGPAVWASNTVIGASLWCATTTVNGSVGTNACGCRYPCLEGTNCPWPKGTNTATFRVRRTDGTNAELTVYYSIGGTASNGLDYVALPGWVTIPAGRRSADIIVVPIDHDRTNPVTSVAGTIFPKAGVRTVLLTLQLPSAPMLPIEVPPAYRIGRPNRASAFILDNDRPRPPCRPFPGDLFHVYQPGTNGLCYRVEVTTNLVDWVTVCTNRVVDSGVHFVDPDAPTFRQRFYRVTPVPCPATDW
jgi:hypothetical protein